MGDFGSGETLITYILIIYVLHSGYIWQEYYSLLWPKYAYLEGNNVKNASSLPRVSWKDDHSWFLGGVWFRYSKSLWKGKYNKNNDKWQIMKIVTNSGNTCSAL